MKCCDGTGYTGNPGVRCVEHFEPMGEEFYAMTHGSVDPGFDPEGVDW